MRFCNDPTFKSSEGSSENYRSASNALCAFNLAWPHHYTYVFGRDIPSLQVTDSSNPPEPYYHGDMFQDA
ncbi:hypothetical protein VTL71DRAFT_1489, partial [Oculimacula yallundae]